MMIVVVAAADDIYRDGDRPSQTLRGRYMRYLGCVDEIHLRCRCWYRCSKVR